MLRHRLTFRKTVASCVPAVLAAGTACAAVSDLGLVTDINIDGLAFAGTDAFGSSQFQIDDTATLSGNDVTSWLLDGIGNFDGVGGFSVPTSNGPGFGPAPNPVPADSVFATIGNASGRLENGNVIRASVWVRQDPANPVTLAPQIEPVLKLEFWQAALQTDADFSNAPNPAFGNRIFDTDQNGNAGTWVDWNNDGTVNAVNGPVAGAALTTDWLLVEQTYVVDDSTWAIGPDAKNVTDVEEIRPVLFFGDFIQTDLTGGGTFLADNFQLEVFANAAAVTANTNPNPDAVVGGIPGDYNNSGLVEQGDLDLVLLNWGTSGTPAGWVNEVPVGIVDQAELDGVLLNWGNTSEPTGSAVPEPATAALLGLGALAMLRRRVA